MHRTLILSGCFTFSRKLKLDCFASSINVADAAVLLALSPVSGSTWYPFIKHASTATNSTWENFLPGHTRGPAAQGKKAPVGIEVSISSPVSSRQIQRLGSHSSESAPHDADEVCRPARLTPMKVFFGMVYEVPLTFKAWSTSVVLGTALAAPNSRSVSCYN